MYVCSYIFRYMPSVPTYIRQSDMEKYETIRVSGKGKWTEFIHNALNPISTSPSVSVSPSNDSPRFSTSPKIPKEPHVNYLKKK